MKTIWILALALLTTGAFANNAFKGIPCPSAFATCTHLLQDCEANHKNCKYKDDCIDVLKQCKDVKAPKPIKGPGAGTAIGVIGIATFL